MKANCEYCGSLDFWIGLYGVPVHKQSCPHRNVQFHQGDTSTLRTAQALKNIIDAYDHYTTSPMVEPESMVFEEILKAKTGHQDPKLYTQQEMDEAISQKSSEYTALCMGYQQEIDKLKEIIEQAEIYVFAMDKFLYCKPKEPLGDAPTYRVLKELLERFKQEKR